MIPVIPRMKFTILTEKTPEEVCHIMEEATMVRNGLIRFSPGGPDFFGEVWDSEFEVMPILPLGVRNSFQPVIVGDIRELGNETAVDIHMRLSWHIFAFCVVWFGMTGLYFAVCLLNLIVGHPDGWKGIVSAVGYFLIVQLLARAGFYIPAKKARRRLEELFGEPVCTE